MDVSERDLEKAAEQAQDQENQPVCASMPNPTSSSLEAPAGPIRIVVDQIMDPEVIDAQNCKQSAPLLKQHLRRRKSLDPLRTSHTEVSSPTTTTTTTMTTTSSATRNQQRRDEHLERNGANTSMQSLIAAPFLMNQDRGSLPYDQKHLVPSGTPATGLVMIGNVPHVPYWSKGMTVPMLLPIGAGTFADPVPPRTFEQPGLTNTFQCILGWVLCCPTTFVCVVLWLVLFEVIDWDDVFDSPW